MQVSQITTNQPIQQSSQNLQDVMQNLNYNDKQLLREALSSVDAKDLPKVIKELTKIPPDTEYLKNLLNTIDLHKSQSNQSEGLNLYA
ncbi:MAG: hypothetical protein GXO62_06325 [Epsilonproteobacteria bacterium]|nr:hypothetical protein [Campylobacterota bacterium]